MKRSLRKDIRAALAAMPPAVAHAKSMAACKRLLAQPEFLHANVLMLYLPMPEEVDVTPIALRSWQEGKTVAAPRISWDQRHLLPLAIHSLEAGTRAAAEALPRLREPVEGQPIPLEMLDLVIVPALAYDRTGNRLGRGAGFYDRFLASPQFGGVAVGLAFREQVVARVPTASNDVPVDMLVTDEEVLRFPSARARGPNDKPTADSP